MHPSRIGRTVATALLVATGLALATRPAAAAGTTTGDIYSAWWDHSIAVDAPGLFANDTGLPPDSVVKIVEQPDVTGGTLVVDNDGSFSYTPPVTSTHGWVISFRYCVATTAAPTSCATNTSYVTLNFNYPGADGDTYDVGFRTPLSIPAPGVLSNDEIRSGMSVMETIPPNHGGVATLNADGSFTYVPPSDYSGPDSFHYCIVAAFDTPPCFAGSSVEVALTIATPTAVADSFNVQPPTLSAPAPGVLVNDGGRPPNSSLDLITDVGHGALTLSADGSFDYIPMPGYTGADSFSYCLAEVFDTAPCISNTATVALNVGPAVVADDSWTVYPGSAIDVAAPGALSNDSVPAETGAQVLVPAQHASSFGLRRNGRLTYEPESGFTGTDTLTYCLTLNTDPFGSCMSAVATVTLNVTEPAPADDGYATIPLTALSVPTPGVLANDGVLAPGAVPVVLAPPLHGSMFTFSADGSFAYTPASDFTGTETFIYCIAPEPGSECADPSADPITVTIEVMPAVAADDNYVFTPVDHGSYLPGPSVLGNDTNVPATASFMVFPTSNMFDVSVSELDSRGLYYHSSPDPVTGLPYLGLGTAAYCVTAVEQTPPCLSNIATIHFDADYTVLGVDLYVATTGQLLQVPAPGLRSNDLHIPSLAAATVVDGPAHAANFELLADGSFTYTSVAGFVGVDTFTYCWTDTVVPSPDCSATAPLRGDPATVAITVIPPDTPPVAVADAYAANGPLTVAVPGLLANDTDIDGDALTASIVTQPTLGAIALAADGSFVYTPNPGASGIDTFTYEADDGRGGTDTGSVLITVTIPDSPPVADADTYSTLGTLTVAAPGLLANDSDADGDTLTASVLTRPATGSLTLAIDGSFVYTPAPDAEGTVTFTYQADDGRGGVDAATVTIDLDRDYIAVVPDRVLDTRLPVQIGYTGAQPAAGQVVTVAVAGTSPVGVPADATAVALNITALNAAADGYVTVWPCGTPRPATSTLNLAASAIVANLAITPTGADGSVCVFTQQAADLVVDIEGYFPANSDYRPVAPQRVLETRAPAPIGYSGASPDAGSTVDVAVAGTAGVLPDAEAVVLNVTGVNAGADGFVTVWACDQARPTASNLNLRGGTTTANLVLVQPSADGHVCLFTQNGADLLADVVGFMPAGSQFDPTTPTRLLDTRAPVPTPSAGQTLIVPVTAVSGVDPSAQAAVLNVTGVDAAAAGYVTVWPCGTPRPLASNVNLNPSAPTPNLAIVGLGTGGSVCIYTQQSADILVDLQGTFP